MDLDFLRAILCIPAGIVVELFLVWMRVQNGDAWMKKWAIVASIGASLFFSAAAAVGGLMAWKELPFQAMSIVVVANLVYKIGWQKIKQWIADKIIKKTPEKK